VFPQAGADFHQMSNHAMSSAENARPYSVVFTISLGLMFGFFCAWLSSLWMLAALGVVALFLSLLKWHALIPLTYLMLTSTIISYSQAPTLSIGIGTLYPTDLLLFLSLGTIIVRMLKESDFKIVRTPLDYPLVIFWSASVISTLIAIIDSSLPWKQCLHETRVVTSYLMFFVVTNLVRDKQQLSLLIKGFLLLATFAALATIAQSFFGKSAHIVLFGRIESAAIEGNERVASVTRVIPPGHSIIVMALTAEFATLLLTRASVLRFLNCGLLALALIATFYRASWLTTGLTMLIIAFQARGQDIKRLIVTGIMAVLTVVIISTTVLTLQGSVGAKLSRAVFERLITVFDSETYESSGSSLRWRDFEYKYALPNILSNPLVGLGLGARYRPLTEYDDKNYDGRSYIHNGHIYVLLKSGIFGYVGLLWFMFGITVRGLGRWRNILDPYMRGIVLAFALSPPAILIVSMVEPYLMTEWWTPVIGIIAGINEIVLRQFSTGSSSTLSSVVR
jgi:hypothetical protein